MKSQSLPVPTVKIVSGGQSGVDRAALDVALARGLPCGGWCPKGRRAEDGPIPPRYPLREAPAAAYAVRTRLNVRDSDATLILERGRPGHGTRLTVALARRMGRPVLIVNLKRPLSDVCVRTWLVANDVHTLNVAGSRESGAPGIYRASVDWLSALFVHTRLNRKVRFAPDGWLRSSAHSRI